MQNIGVYRSLEVAELVFLDLLFSPREPANTVIFLEKDNTITEINIWQTGNGGTELRKLSLLDYGHDQPFIVAQI